MLFLSSRMSSCGLADRPNGIEKETMGATMKTITLAIEHSERELDPKILLAKRLLDDGYRVIIGSTEAIDIFLRRAKPCIVFHKSTYNNRSSFYKSLGHFFCFLDEEGGPATPRGQFAEFCKDRYYSISPKNQDLVFFPSKKYITEIKKFSDTRGVRLVASGWPRADLWRPEFHGYFAEQVTEIKERHGAFFMFVSSFGALTEIRRQQMSQNPYEGEGGKKISTFRKSRLNDYLILLNEIKGRLMPGEKLIIRPHPSEDTQTWKKIIKEDSRLEIVREGNVTPWLIACKGVLHFGSTVALQTAVMGKASVQFRVPHIKGVTDSPCFDLTVNATSTDEVMLALRTKTSGNNLTLQMQVLQEELRFGDSGLAVDRITAELNKLNAPKIDLTSFGRLERLQADFIYFGSSLKSWFRETLRLQGEQTIAEKIPGGLSAQNIVSSLKKLMPYARQEHEIESLSLARNLIVLEPKSTE